MYAHMISYPESFNACWLSDRPLDIRSLRLLRIPLEVGVGIKPFKNIPPTIVRYPVIEQWHL